MNTDANNHPVQITKELAHTADMPVGQQQGGVMRMPDLGEPIVRESEAIEPVASPLTKNDFDALMFMEELVEIRIEPLQEENPRKLIDVYVNGVPEWIPVGRPWIVKRKYVEVLARAKPINVKTQHENVGEAEFPRNEVVRTVRSQFPFTILRDTMQGIEWMNRLQAEG